MGTYHFTTFSDSGRRGSSSFLAQWVLQFSAKMGARRRRSFQWWSFCGFMVCSRTLHVPWHAFSLAPLRRRGYVRSARLLLGTRCCSAPAVDATRNPSTIVTCCARHEAVCGRGGAGQPGRQQPSYKYLSSCCTAVLLHM